MDHRQNDSVVQYNETDPLKKVIVGRYENYSHVSPYVEIINEVQKKGLPRYELVKQEVDRFRQVLMEEGVEVLIPSYVGKFVYDQLTPRDLGVVIGEQFVLCNMLKKSRRYESAGIFPYIDNIEGKEPNVLLPESPTCFLEAGDIMVDDRVIYVGVSQRTNEEGIEFLKRHFGDRFDIVPIYGRLPEDGEDVLHLDCGFGIIGKRLALIYEEGFKKIPDLLIDKYELISVSKCQQQGLITNGLPLTAKKLICRKLEQNVDIYQKIRDKGIKLIELPFDNFTSCGGSFRCCTLPLQRIPFMP